MTTLRNASLILFAAAMVAFPQNNTAAKPIPLSNGGTPNAGIDFTVVLKDLDGKAMTYQKEQGSQLIALSLGDAAINALNASLPEDQAMTGVAKLERFELMKKIHGSKSAVLTATEVAQVKERISKVYGPLVVGAAWEFLDKK